MAQKKKTQEVQEQSPSVALGLLLTGSARDAFDAASEGDAPSVDLDARGRAKLQNFYELRKLSGRANQLLEGDRDAIETGRLGAVACLNNVWRRLLEIWRAQVNPTGFEQEIGRASCRERVEIWMDDG